MPRRATPSDKLIATLRRLRAAGQTGFEGLILDLLTQLIGRPFRIAHSGSQAGRDMSTASGGDLVIAVECKRFGKTTDFDDSQLLGKIVEAKRDLHPDIWVLVTSRSVGDRTATSLRAYAESEDIETLILDCTPGGSGYLPALCAAYPDVTVASLAPYAECRKIRGWLSRIREDRQHQVFIEALRRALHAPHIGYASTANTLLERFLGALAEGETSKVRLGQRILPRARDSHDVPRAEFIARLDMWWHNWGNRRDILVVEGDEGTGKSWALASWLASRLPECNEIPVLVWLSAQFFEFSNLPKIAIDHLKKEFPARSPEVHEKRFRAWARIASDLPRVVIVVDGLNERASRSKWQSWLSDARHSLSELNGAALILTSRSIFWREIAEDIQHIVEINPGADFAAGLELPAEDRPESKVTGFCQVGLGDFNDLELEEAMGAAGLSRESIEPDLASLIRKPRFFSIAARHWARLTASGDFTRERLFFEEWRDRISSRKQQELSDLEFGEILVGVARIARESTNSTISRSRLVKLLPPRNDWEDRLIDLISSGVFEIVPGAPGKYRTSKERLYVGLGLLLLEEAVLCSSDIDASVEAVTRVMEPAGDADDVSAIMRYSVCAALVSSGPHSAPQEARIAVLLALARQRNGADAWQQAAPWIYYPDNPSVILEAAELEWSREPLHSEARERFSFCLSHVADKWPLDSNLIQRVANWLGYAYPDGRVAVGSSAQQRSPGEESFSTRLAEAKSVIASLDLQICIQEIKEEGALRVSQLAFLVASHWPRQHYVNALLSWALSRSIMKFPLESDEARWLIRTANAEARKEISVVATRLAGLENQIARKASALLFRVEGSRESLAQAESLAPLRPLPDFYWWDTIEEAYSARSKGIPFERIAKKLSALALDPAVDFKQFSGWGFEAILDEIDTSAMGGNQRTDADGRFESAEQTLCRLAPRALSELFLRAVYGQLDRMPGKVLPYLLKEAFILLKPEDLCRIEEVRKGLERNFASTAEDHGEEAELAGIWLASLANGEAQLAYLLSRRQDFDDQDWSAFLEPLSLTTVHQVIDKSTNATGLERRRCLCFPWRQAFELNESDRQKLRAAADDEEVGTVGALVPQHAQDAELLIRFAEDGYYNDELLSRIFKKRDWARSAAPAMSARLGEKIGLASKTWAIAQDGLKETDIIKWAKQLDVEIRGPHGPRNLAPDGYYSPEMLSKAFDVAPDILDSWIDSVIDQDGCGSEIITMRLGLLEGLVLELLNRNDRRGFKVISAVTGPRSGLVVPVDRDSRVISHYFWPFEAEATAAAQEAVAWLLDLALNNDDIQQLAFAAFYYGRSEVLMKVAEEPAEGGLAFLAARSLMISGLSPYDAAKADQFWRIEQCESSWVRFAAKQARFELQRDGRAQHWFRLFLCSLDRTEAWAAFRLFLECVDRRWLLWQDRELQAARNQPDYQMRLRHLILNWKEINERVEKRANEQKKQLFAWPLPGFDLVPWKRAWSL